MTPEGTANLQRWAELATPDESPNWDCNTEEGRGHLERYQAAILQGLKRGARKAMSISKPSQVIQRESESLSAAAAAKSLQSCPTLCDPIDGSQAPPSLGFSRQEHWSGLPFPSPVHERNHSLSSMKDCLRPVDFICQ